MAWYPSYVMLSDLLPAMRSRHAHKSGCPGHYIDLSVRGLFLLQCLGLDQFHGPMLRFLCAAFPSRHLPNTGTCLPNQRQLPRTSRGTVGVSGFCVGQHRMVYVRRGCISLFALQLVVHLPGCLPPGSSIAEHSADASINGAANPQIKTYSIEPFLRPSPGLHLGVASHAQHPET